tara:strand:- start:1104 stop:1256 length:153 start_codon:yes stop_codon:yes gene_type:complete
LQKISLSYLNIQTITLQNMVADKQNNYTINLGLSLNIKDFILTKPSSLSA